MKNLNAQENISLDSLINVKSILTKEISFLNDSIKKINLSIALIESKKIRAQIKDSSIKAISTGEAKLRTNPNAISTIILILPENTIVTIIDYINGYYGVCCDSICGYMNEMWINSTEELRSFINIKKREQFEVRQILEQKKLLENEQNKIELEKQYIKKYGQTVYNKLKQGIYWIGINEEMAVISLGSPDDVNRTVTK